MVNEMHQAVGLEEFVTLFNWKGFKKDMPVPFASSLALHQQKVSFVVADVACRGF